MIGVCVTSAPYVALLSHNRGSPGWAPGIADGLGVEATLRDGFRASMDAPSALIEAIEC